VLLLLLLLLLLLWLQLVEHIRYGSLWAFNIFIT
jgi:hypothetical protein